MTSTIRKGMLAGTLALLALTSASGVAQAQARRYSPVYPPSIRVYPDPRVQQYAANVAALGRAYSYVPPYALGYNPYPTTYLNAGLGVGITPTYVPPTYVPPTYVPPTYVPPTYTPYTLPYYSNPYASFNPYYYNPYALNPYSLYNNYPYLGNTVPPYFP